MEGRRAEGHLLLRGSPPPSQLAPYSLLQPNDASPVKLNTAAILREGALYQRQVERELQRWVAAPWPPCPSGSSRGGGAWPLQSCRGGFGGGGVGPKQASVRVTAAS